MSNIYTYEKKKKWVSFECFLNRLLYKINRCPSCGSCSSLSVEISDKSNKYIYCNSCDLKEHNLKKFVIVYKNLYFKKKDERKKSARI